MHLLNTTVFSLLQCSDSWASAKQGEDQFQMYTHGLHQCTKMVQIGNQTENIQSQIPRNRLLPRFIQSQIHKVYLRMSADSGPVGPSLILAAAAAEALEAVLAGLMAEEAAAQHEEAAATK